MSGAGPGYQRRTDKSSLAVVLVLPHVRGAVLEDVTPGCSADSTGLHPGEVVVATDEKPILGQTLQYVAYLNSG
jgi:S1-C subfamily serine protease